MKELGGTARKPGRSHSSKTATSAPSKSSGKKRRKRKGGSRGDQAVKWIEQNPGIGASDIAKQMKIKPNYLYRVLGDLEKEKRVKKDGRAYHPA